ncbi:MAG: hypothetical protein ACTHMB_14380, partial [Candidatus Binatia bacterium]
MATPEFVYQEPLPIEKDSTRYRLLTKEYVSVINFEGNEILKIDPAALTLLANVAIRDVSFLLRTAHMEKLPAIIKDPQASDNDPYVSLAVRLVESDHLFQRRPTIAARGASLAARLKGLNQVLHRTHGKGFRLDRRKGLRLQGADVIG